MNSSKSDVKNLDNRYTNDRSDRCAFAGIRTF